jgi:hypothetical protein
MCIIIGIKLAKLVQKIVFGFKGTQMAGFALRDAPSDPGLKIL